MQNFGTGLWYSNKNFLLLKSLNEQNISVLSGKSDQNGQHFNYMTVHTWSSEVQMHGIVWYVGT